LSICLIPDKWTRGLSGRGLDVSRQKLSAAGGRAGVREGGESRYQIL
jgi:hypothetical protein